MVGFRVVGCRVVYGSRSMIGSGSRSVVGSRRGRMVGSRGRGVVRGGSRSRVSHIRGWVVRKGSHWVEGVGSQGRAVDGVNWGSSCVHQGVVCSMGLVDSVRDSCAVSVDHLMAGLVSGGSHHQGRNSDKGLQNQMTGTYSFILTRYISYY